MAVLLEVCLGTTCFVMGGQELMALEDHFPDSWKGAVEIRATPCLNECGKKGCGHGPFVRLDGAVIPAAHPDGILRLLEEKLGGGAV